MEFYKSDLKEIYKKLESSEKGLSSKKAKEFLEKFGPNELKQKKKISPIKIFLSQFNDPLIWILIAAAMISFFLNEQVDAIVIGIIVVLNAIIGFKQEYSAEKAIDALKKMSTLKTIVLRDGEQKEVDAKEIVPGDILVLSEGNKIPADARLISLASLFTQEAALTGESNAVEKEITFYKQDRGIGDRKNMVFSGTVITQGKGLAVVCKTGMNTEIGKIAKLLESTEKTMTPLQIKMDDLGKKLSLLTIIVCLIVFIVGAWRSPEMVHALESYAPTIEWFKVFLFSIKDSFLEAVALAVAAIPEGLPAVVTIALALGIKRMIKRNALIRKLPSVETLGSTTVICSDKTGTLTHNQMTVKKIYVDSQVVDVEGAGYEPEGEFSDKPKDIDLLLRVGLLNNDSKHVKEEGKYKIIGDPTEGALVVSAAKSGLDKEAMDKKYPRLEEIPFDSSRKMMTTVHKVNNTKQSYTKGAPDILLKNCDRIIVDGKVKKIDAKIRKQILDKNMEFSNEALRVLGFAYKELNSKSKKSEYEKNMIFVGLQGMIDPPRKEVKDAIAKCKTASIKVVMITGDYVGTAKAIAAELGIKGKAILGEELKEIDLDKEVENIGVYARVNPEDKMRIVEALQKKGHVVAMTGDGVNDAPALKKSDIGISMGITGTDVAKESSDMILTDDNFTSIVNAVEEGRGVYDNIKKFFAFLISGNIGEVLIIFLAIIFGWPIPLTATQLLLINLVTDGLPAVALGADPFEPNSMTRKPRPKNEKIYENLSHFLVGYPIIMVIVVLWLFFTTWTSTGEVLRAQTVAFLSITMFEMFQAFSARSIRYTSFKVGLFKNSYLLLAVVTSLIVTTVVLYMPFFQGIFDTVALPVSEVVRVILFSSAGFIYLETTKFLKEKKLAA